MAVVRAERLLRRGRGTSRPTGSPTRRTDPLLHFVDEGWRDLRAPSLDFDLWWYTCTYLDPTAEDVNPLLHYLLVGPARRASSPCPARRPAARPPATPRGNGRAGPACSPGYDRDGIIDDYVVHYLRELARHADVFYLADGVLEPGELDKLDGHRRRGLEHPARGVRLRLLVAAGPRPGRAGTGSTATTR